MKKIDKSVIEDITSLTPMQEGLLFHYLKDPGSDRYCEQLSLEISGEIDGRYFEQAWNRVIKANDMLRAVFRWKKLEKPSQIFLKEHLCRLSFYDLSGKAKDQKNTALAEIKKNDRREMFDLQVVPFRVILCKLEERKYEAIISNHHILYDGWSTGVILEEFFKAYHELSNGGQSVEFPFKPPFKEFIKWIQGRDKNSQEQYWRDYFTGVETPTELPIKTKRSIEESPGTEDYTIVLTGDTGTGLDAFVKNNRLTLASVFYTAWGILLQKYCGGEDVIFGTTVSGRAARIKGIEDMVGLFINTIPLRVQASPGVKLIDMVSGIENAMRVREEFESTPLPDIMSYSTAAGGGSLFDTIVAIENYPLDNRLVPDGCPLAILSYSIAEMTHYDLTVSVMPFDEIAVKFSYNQGLFDRESVENLAGHFKGIIRNIIGNPGAALSQLEIISSEEKNRVLYEFNDTETAFPGDKTIHELFEEQVESNPDRIAVVGSTVETLRATSLQITYRQLDDQSNRLAQSLIEKGVLAEDSVAIMLERSIEMTVGILGILKAGGAYLPIDPEYPQERIDYMLADSNAKIVIGKEELQKQIIVNCQLLIVNCKLEGSPRAPYHHSSFIIHHSNHLCYIIYTSGTTGKPKGVMVCHRNVVRLVKNANFVPLNEGTRILQTGAPVFDATTFEIWGSLLNGGRLVLTDKETILDAQRLGKVLKKNFINTLWLSSPLFNQLMKQSMELFSSLRYLLVGGDVLSPGNINRVKRQFPGLSIINGYGPTENTTFSTTYLIEKEFEHNIPIGRPIANSTAYIYDKNNCLAPVGAVGELCVGGGGLARGYLNRPELTEENFNRSYRSNKTYILYKTGDLARWLPCGNIEFLGRIDRQVKIRGFRIELEEIESRLLNHPRVREVVVAARESDNGDDKYLCAYIVPAVLHGSETLETEELLDYLAAELPDYMVPGYFVMLEKIPLNPNGKVDRKALPEPDRNRSAARDYVSPRNEMQHILVGMFSEVLGIDRKRIGIHDNFFRLGGHSLKSTGLAVRIHKRFDIEIPLGEIFKAPTVGDIAQYIETAKKNKQLPIEPVEKREYYSLSPAQERFFVFQRMEPDSVSYNIPEILRLDGTVVKEKFETVVKEMIRRHESLRTSFELVDGKPVQRVHNWEEAAFDVEYEEFPINSRQLAGSDIPGAFKVIEKNFMRPFDLSCFPLLRLRLVKVAEEVYFLLFDIHHIISDGVSAGIFIEEFLALYNGEKLPAVTIQYKDYINWISEKRKRDGVETIGSGAVRGGRPEEPAPDREEVLHLPTDYPRPAVPNYDGEIIPFEIEEWQKEALFALSMRQNTTLYMILLSAYNIFLSKLSDQDNIVVGSPMAGRVHQDLARLIGLFINTLVIRNFPAGEKRFLEFLAEVKENTLRAFDNQQYQYERLADKIRLAADTGRNPLFDVMFALQNMKMPPIVFPGIKVTRYRDLGWASKFDMTLYCEEYNNYLFKLEYSSSLFKPETIRRFIGYFKNVIARIAVDSNQKIAEIDILPGEEKQELIYNLNNTAVDFPQDKTIFQMFHEQAGRTPGRIAVISMAQGTQSAGTTGKTAITYRQLQEKVNRVASFLGKRGLKANIAAGIMMERSVEALAAILGVLTAGGAYVPIDPEYPGNRIGTMLENSRAAFLLTDSGIVRKQPLDFLSRRQEILVLDEEEEGISREPAADLPFAGAPGDLIYIIFTSGSTGTPKGAGVYHRGFMNLMHWFVGDFNLGEKDSNLWITSLSFDLTQKNLYASLITGGALYIPRFNYFEPRALLGEIHHNRVTWINCTPSMFYKLVEYDGAVEEKQLTSLRYVFLGGEPIYMSALIGWLESEECRAEIVNTYGPTECADICNSYRIKEPRKFLDQPIPVGKPIYNVQLFVTDKNLRLVPLGIPGELLIGGAGVGSGYVDDKELTRRKFLRHSFAGEADRLIYRTGDLVKRLSGGDIEFLGRIDHQVKVRGFRIELGEIENRLLGRPQVKEAVVIARGGEGGDDKYLCAYIVPAAPHTVETLKTAELRDYLAAELPYYMVPSYFVPLEKMPLNPNGKVDRKALPEPDRRAGRDYVPPQNERENVLVNIWSEILGIDRKRIGIHDNFFQLGGHSLKAVGLIARIHMAFSVEVSIAELFKTPTVKGISDYIDSTTTSIYLSIEPVEKKECYPLSSVQKRLFFIHRVEPLGITYNLPCIMRLSGKLEVDRFEGAFKQLIHRHESLRTSFEIIAEEPAQRVHDSVEFEIDKSFAELFQKRLPEGPPEAIIKSFIRAFDLSKAPLLRVGLLKEEENGHILMVDMHHIISDGMSMGIFVREFMALYADKTLPDIRFQYKDYAEWQRSAEQREVLKGREKYWLEQFEAEIPALNLPTDYVRPRIQSFEGRSIAFEIGPHETTQLKELAVERNTTLYMILLAAFGILISKLSGREDIVIGTPTAGRRHVDLESIIGMFVNTLALRHSPQGEKSFEEFLGEVTRCTLEVFENQDYPFEDLVEKVVQNRDMGRNPLFDVMFVLQNIDISEIVIPGLKMSPYPYENATAKFDILLSGVEEGDRLHFDFEYCGKLFQETTIHRFIGFYKRIISTVLENPCMRLCDMEIISEEERKQVLVNFNNTAQEYPADKAIDELFAEQVERSPDSIAVFGSTVETLRATSLQITYRQLNERSDRLACFLIEKGVLADDIIGIMMERSIDMVIGIIGILKASGVYMPIDAEYPQERIDYMLKDSGARILLTTGDLGEKGRIVSCQSLIFHCELLKSTPRATFHHSSFIIYSSSRLAYIIYTSGSTGRPKGVIVGHRNVMNLVIGLKERIYGIYNRYLKVAMVAPFVFDASIKQIFGALLLGHGLYIVPEKTRLDSDRLRRFFLHHKIDITDVTPAHVYMLSESERPGPGELLKSFLYPGHFIVGGDALSPRLVERFYNCFAKAQRPKITNIYGPTECTVDSTCFEVPVDHLELFDDLPIGRPLPNHFTYILSAEGRLQPIGVPGELCIAGDGVARGYLNQPELTSERFIDFQRSSFIILHSKLYRTGDLARWLPDGNIDFLGRIDSQVKIRGFRIELGEIESELLKHEQIKDAVVISRRGEIGDNYLCAYLVPHGEQKVSISALREYLGRRLPDYMSPAYFVYLDRLPLTPNGKIDRRGLPEPEIKTGKDHAAPREEVEKKLVVIWSEILGRDAMHALELQTSIGIDDNFFQLGGHSLKAAVMTAKVHKALHVEIPLARVFEIPTIRGLSGYIKETKKKGYDPIEKAPEQEYYELSSAQKRLYILQEMEPGSTGYNMPLAINLEGELDTGKLEGVFGALIARHESLRTSFEAVGDRPVQKIHAEVDFKIEYYAAGGFEISRFVRFFDLSRAPLLRVGLVKIRDKEHILTIDMHHIIADGTSMAILYKEMMALYQGDTLPSIKITYKDYAVWQNSQKYKEVLNRQEMYWREQFAGEIPVLNLPIDYPRPVMRSFDGNRVDFELGRGETELLKKLALDRGVTLYMALLTACNIWFSKLSGEEDIVIGTPIAGRRREEFQCIIGMFVNTLPLRNYPAPGKNFAGFLEEVKDRTMEAFQEQDYQFEDLVEKVVIERDTSRNPLFDVMFVFQNMEIPVINVPGLSLRPYEYENKTSKFDLNLAGMEQDDRLTFSLEYSTKLFKAETTRKFVGYFKNIIRAVTVDPAVSLADIEIIDQEEKKRILEISSGITEPIDLNETIHGWFEKVVLGNEHKTALVFRDGRITYGELNRRANRLASLMRSRGVGPDKVVGLMVKRAFEMVIGMLGIMKAGGAYLPIDPGLPGVRKEFMIEDGNISALATNFDIEEEAGYIPRNLEPIDIRNEYFSQGSGENLQPITRGSDLVYVLFTSGSTGTPKGVMLEHTNLVNLVKFQLEYTNIDFSKILQFTTISFDVSFQEIFTTLLGRGELYLIPEETRNHIPELFGFISKNIIKTLFLPMSFIKLIFSQDDYLEIFPGSVEHIVTAGEQVVVSDRFRNYLKRHQVYLHNHYGPAETHVITTLTINPTGDIPGFPSIGKPIMNTRIYILDKGKHLQPAGIAGELYAGGLQVGRGYLNNRELTVERFNRSYRSYRTHILYKTGDLARWLPNGNIEFLGRIDHQVKIRGIRVEPGEIENHLKKIAFIKEAVVAVKQRETGDKYLCAYVVLDTAEEPDISKLRNILSVNIPDYMIPAYFAPVEKIPLTPSGKVDRKALPEPELKASEKYTAPRDEIENKMVEIWSEILSVGREAISVTGNFFHLGGHSLKAIGLINKIHKTFGVTIALQDVFRYPTIADISRIIKNSKVTGFKDIEKQPQKEYYELSYSQKRLWYISKTEPDNPLFNMPGVTTLFEAIDEALVRRVVERLTSRHESLRTSFKEIDKEPVQVIEPVERLKINLEVIDLSELTGPEREKRREELFAAESMHIFNLAQPPLFRVKIIKCAVEEYDLVFNMHHIISDGWSMEVLKQEFRQLVELYKSGADPLMEPLELQYKDYTAWQNRLLADEEQVGKAREFWRGQLSGNLPVLNLPYDFSRPSGVDSKESAGYRWVIPGDLANRLRSLAADRQASLFMVLLAGFNLLLARVTGQEEIMIAIPAAARQHEALKNIIGLFVNTLILRNRVAAHEPFPDFFNRLQDNTFKVLEFQGIPLESICGQLKIKYPEVFVFFNMVNTGGAQQENLNNLDSYHLEKVQNAKFDIVVYLTEYRNGIAIDCHYYKNRFKPITIEKLMEQYKEILAGIAGDPAGNLGEYLMSGKKRKLKRGGNV